MKLNEKEIIILYRHTFSQFTWQNENDSAKENDQTKKQIKKL